MGTARVSVAVYADAERLKMNEKPTASQEDESLAALLAKGATQVVKAFGSEAKPQADYSTISAPSKYADPSLEANSHRMPSFRNLRTRRPWKKETEIGYSDEGQSSPVRPCVLMGRDPIPQHARMIRTTTPNCLEDSVDVDSRTKTNGAVESSEDLASGSKRRCSSSQRQGASPKLLSKAKEESQIAILTTNKRRNQTTHTTTMNQDAQTSPYSNQRMNSYAMPQQAPMLDSYSRPRSRAIAIKRTHRCAEELAASQTEESNERMYDWATWRMYNRIVDHRRNQNFGAPGPLPVSVPHSKPQPVQDSNLSNGLSDLTYDGEVFELEI